MSDIVIMNQTEAAAYISDHHQKMDGSMLSRMTKYGRGPKFQKKGNQKLFLKRDVDAWISEQRSDSTSDSKGTRPDT